MSYFRMYGHILYAELTKVACHFHVYNYPTGTPLPVVAIAVGIAHDQYGTND